MKKQFFLLLLTFLATYSNAQQVPIVGQWCTFVSSTTLKQCNGSGSPLPGAIDENMPNDLLFKVTKRLATASVIQIIKWNVDYKKDGLTPSNQSQQNKYDNNTKYRGTQADASTQFYLLDDSKLGDIKKLEKRADITFATSSTLLKDRFGSKSIAGDIGNDFNIGLLLALSIKQDEDKMHFLTAGINPGFIKITPATTKSFVTEDVTVASFSPNIGYIFQVKGAQVGFMTGIDILTGKAYRSWDHRGRPWIGFGVGFSLFKIGSTVSSTPSQR